MNKFIKSFIAISVSGGILWTLIMALYWASKGYIYSFKQYLSIAIIVGFLAGFFLTLFVSIVDYFSTKKYKKIKESANVRNEKSIIVNLDYNEAFETSKKALTSIGGRIINEDRENGVITARTGLSWKSFGENVKIEITKLSNQQTQVKVSSVPMIRATILDYGKNYENVCGICNVLIGKENPTR